LGGTFNPEILTDSLSRGVKQEVGEENKPFSSCKCQYDLYLENGRRYVQSWKLECLPLRNGAYRLSLISVLVR